VVVGLVWIGSYRRFQIYVTTQHRFYASRLTSFDMRIGRSYGNRETLLLDFPAIKLSPGSPAVSGKIQDVMIDAGFQTVMHATLGYTLSVGRFWHLPGL
jgi:hypothetical protein